jgi:hypothetical protein
MKTRWRTEWRSGVGRMVWVEGGEEVKEIIEM